MKNEVLTKAYVEWAPAVVDNNGKVIKEADRGFTSEAAFNKAVTKAKEKNEQEPRAIAMGSFKYSYPETWDEALALSGGNTEIAMRHFNYGASLRQHGEVQDLLTASDFTPSEEPIDISYSLATVAERRAASPEEKAAKTLGITPEQLRAALELVRGQAAGATAS